MNSSQQAASNRLLGAFTWLLHVKLFDVPHVLAQGILEVPLGHMGAGDVTAAQHDGRGERYHPPARKGEINCNCRTREGRRWVDAEAFPQLSVLQFAVNFTSAMTASFPTGNYNVLLVLLV